MMAFSWLFRNRLRKAHSLLEQYGTATEVWNHLDEDGMQQALRRADEEAAFAERHRIEVLTLRDDTYPFRLRQCPDAPLLLYSKGCPRPNEGRMVSVVGTRECTELGKELTRRLVLDLAAMLPDVTIISGLAYGIDVEAHKAALEAGIPTLIITGHGLDRIYPAYHRNIAVRALDNGGILTEYMSGTDPDRQNFIARDRIIAGLADAVVVVESKEKGGALITARMALDYDRSLFAFPGRVQDVTSQGCNLLIRDQKAGLIQGAEDLIAAMMWKTETDRRPPVQTEMTELFEPLSEQEERLLHAIRSQEDGIHVNFLQAECGLPYPDTVSTLTLMEMKGLVKALPGGIYRALR